MTSHLRRLMSVAAMAAVVVAPVACALNESPAPVSSTGSVEVDTDARRVVEGFTAALNRGDSVAARAFLSPSARFDSVGRIYPDRDAIFDRFLEPEVIAVGGQYTERSARTEDGRLVVEYAFTTRAGGQERFTYAYQIRDGLITDVIGRYV